MTKTNQTRRQFLKSAGYAAAAGAVGIHGLQFATALGATPTQVLTGLVGDVEVPQGEVWELAGDVTLTGDLAVRGVLMGRAGSRVGTDGPHRAIRVLAGGAVDIQGTPKKGWNRTGTDPSWSAQDEVRMAPVAPGDTTSFPAFSPGSQIPSFDSRVPAAEVFNLTRDLTFDKVRLHFSGAAPSIIKFASFNDAGVGAELGAYPIHWHLNGDSPSGTIVEGVVVMHSENRAFVPHGSHGISFKDCIAFDIKDDAFWWDKAEDDSDTFHHSHRISYDHCLAALIWPGVGETGRNIAGFQLGQGNDCIIADSAAVGVNGHSGSAGFSWPEASGLDGVWVFSQGNVTHNNLYHGIRTWQNGVERPPHVVENFAIYAVGNAGINHGAYANNYIYRNFSILGSRHGVICHATSKEEQLTFENAVIDVDQYGVIITGTKGNPEIPTLFHNLQIAAATKLLINNDLVGDDPRYDRLIDCGIMPDDVEFRVSHSDSVYVIQNGTEAFQIDGAGVVTGTAALASSQFSDITGNPHAEDIESLAELGVTKGCEPGRYCPDLPVIRAHMALFLMRLWRALGHSPDGTVGGFTDIGPYSEETKQAVEELAGLGVTTGTAPGVFSPADEVTRWQMALFLTRLLERTGLSLPDGSDQGFGDIGSLPESAQKSINQLAQLEITRGTAPGQFSPSSSVKRDQMASFLMRTTRS